MISDYYVRRKEFSDSRKTLHDLILFVPRCCLQRSLPTLLIPGVNPRAALLLSAPVVLLAESSALQEASGVVC